MIKLFRKIRYNLMETGKTTKYFKYAIGEIILVVIGILIAIQLNEWRLDSSNNKQKQIVLKALQLEFEANLKQVDTVLFYIGKVKEYYPLANSMIKNPDLDISKSDVGDLIENLGFTWTFNPSNGALRSAISSSQIHLLKNNRLIELLFSWEDVVKDSEEEAQRLRKHQYDSYYKIAKYMRMSDAWRSNFPEMVSANKPSDYKGLLKDVFFEDYSSLSYAFADEYITELNIIKSQNKEILAIIKEEIND